MPIKVIRPKTVAEKALVKLLVHGMLSDDRETIVRMLKEWSTGPYTNLLRRNEVRYRKGLILGIMEQAFRYVHNDQTIRICCRKRRPGAK